MESRVTTRYEKIDFLGEGQVMNDRINLLAKKNQVTTRLIFFFFNYHRI